MARPMQLNAGKFLSFPKNSQFCIRHGRYHRTGHTYHEGPHRRRRVLCAHGTRGHPLPAPHHQERTPLWHRHRCRRRSERLILRAADGLRPVAHLGLHHARQYLRHQDSRRHHADGLRHIHVPHRAARQLPPRRQDEGLAAAQLHHVLLHHALQPRHYLPLPGPV